LTKVDADAPIFVQKSAGIAPVGPIVTDAQGWISLAHILLGAANADRQPLEEFLFVGDSDF